MNAKLNAELVPLPLSDYSTTRSRYTRVYETLTAGKVDSRKINRFDSTEEEREGKGRGEKRREEKRREETKR